MQVTENEARLPKPEFHNTGQVANHEQGMARKLAADLARSMETNRKIEETAQHHLTAHAIRDSEYKQSQALSVQQAGHIMQRSKA